MSAACVGDVAEIDEAGELVNAGALALDTVDDELDRIAGSSVLYVDDHFPTAMSLGYASVYRRRPRRSS